MGWPAETLSALCNWEIRGSTLPSRWLVCLSERHHGDRRPVMPVEQSLLATPRNGHCPSDPATGGIHT